MCSNTFDKHCRLLVNWFPMKKACNGCCWAQEASIALQFVLMSAVILRYMHIRVSGALNRNYRWFTLLKAQ